MRWTYANAFMCMYLNSNRAKKDKFTETVSKCENIVFCWKWKEKIFKYPLSEGVKCKFDYKVFRGLQAGQSQAHVRMSVARWDLRECACNEFCLAAMQQVLIVRSKRWSVVLSNANAVQLRTVKYKIAFNSFKLPQMKLCFFLFLRFFRFQRET